MNFDASYSFKYEILSSRVVELRVMVIVKFLFLFFYMPLLNLSPLIYCRLLSKGTLSSRFIIISCDISIMKDLGSRQRYGKKSFT